MTSHADTRPAAPAAAGTRTGGFPRSARLLAAADFGACFASGERIGGKLLRVHWLSTGRPARLGLAVSRKVDTRAVVRNRIKRAARESFRFNLPALPAADYVIVPKREAAAATLAELRADLAALWQRLALKARTPQGTMRAGSTPRAAAPADSPSSSSAVEPPAPDAPRLSE